MITIEDLDLRYGKSEVIKDLNLQISPGSIHGLVGLNGSGKTTLLNSIYGLKQADKGEISFNGRPISRREIAYLETNNYFYNRTKGKEYLSLFCLNNKKFSIKEWNTLFDLPLEDFIDHYSTGMKKKLAFMGVIALDTPIVILDEPFNGVDLETTQKLKLIILALREKGKTIIITSHILESMTSICDAISYLNHKSIQATFNKGDYAAMETSIFGRFNEENNLKIKKLLG